jgi:CubicO group peptidase (beta-lactamase class C family)|tara:strand:+ start:128648 stop:130033 length:1386 start_codon:yes stop_codon:yes gene_type:complete
MMKHAAVLTVLITMGTAPAVAQDADYIRALAAGYEAAFTCSATFNAGQTPAEIDANELNRIYDEYRNDVGELSAVIDEDAKTVSVSYSENMPPRVAAWRPNLGCSQLPIGADPSLAASLPTVEGGPPQFVRAPDWPWGDAGAERLSNDPDLTTRVEAAFDSRTYGAGSKTSAILIVKDGRIIAERYAHGVDADTPQRTWSVAKSIAGTVLGIAAAQQKIDLLAPAQVPEWQSPLDPRRQITTDHLMRMASGLTSDFAGNRTDAIYIGGTSVADSAPGQPLLHEPGSTFRYSNNDILLSLYGLRHAMGDDDAYRALPFTDLFWKIGMTRTFPETDWRGDFVMSSQVWTTARDLARLGLLYLNDGVWEGERLLPLGFVKRVSTMGPAQPDREWGYGGTFWVAQPQTGLPRGTFAAFGNRGQYLVIVPDRDILVIRRGYDPIGEDGGFDVTAFSRDVVAALEGM